MDDRARRGVGWLALVSAATKGSQLVVTLVLAALFSASDLGVVALTLALINTAMIVQSMGVTAVIGRTERDPDRMAGTVLTMTSLLALLLTAAGIGGAPVLARALDAPAAAPLLATASIGLPFMAVAWVQLAVMSRSLDFHLRFLPDVGSALAGAAVTIGLALNGSGPMAVAVGFVVTAVAQPVLGVVVGVRVRPCWDADAAREAAHWIVSVGTGVIAATVVLNIDYPIVSRVLGPDALGVYSLAFRFAFLPYALLGTVFASVAFALYANVIRDGRRGEAVSAQAHFTHLLLVTVGGMYVVIGQLADRIVLLGERWAPAIPALILLCAFGVGRAVLTLWCQMLMATGRLRWYAGFECGHLALLAVSLLLFARFGVVAVAFVQAVAVWTIVAGVWVALAREQVAPAGRDLLRAVVGLAVPAGACAALAAAVHQRFPSTVLGAVGEGAVLVCCFAAVAGATNRSLVVSLVRRPRAVRP